MNLKRLRCLLVIMAFSMPLFAETPVGQLDSFDDINDTNWVEVVAENYGSYMKQEVNDVNMEGTGSMKIDFNDYVWPVKDDEPIRTFSPVLDVNYQNQAITLWVWSEDINESRSQTAGSRLVEIILYDSTVGPQAHVGRFTVLPLKNVGWNKVIAPFRNFMWKDGTGDFDFLDPCDAEWDKITKIGLWARTEGSLPNQNAIYIDDMRLEVAPNEPNRPYQIASCDDLVDELWDELRGSGVMLQTPPGDANLLGWKDPNGSMMIDFTLFGTAKPDICPSLYPIPAWDFTDYRDWAITVWVWTDLVEDEKLKEIILHDAGWGDYRNLGRFRVQQNELIEGWNKVTARLDEFLWNVVGNDDDTISPDDVRWDAITKLEIWTDCWEDGGDPIYLDDFQLERAVEVLSEAKVQNADKDPPATITVDGITTDWATLDDSDIVDFDLQAVTDPNGNLHVEYRLAWDPNYLYILVEEQNEPGTGDTEAYEAAHITDGLYAFAQYDVGTDRLYDSLALFFDFRNNKSPGIPQQISFYLFLGLSSTERTDLMAAMTNGLWTDQCDYGYGCWDIVGVRSLEHGSVATKGTLGNRVIEAKVSWQNLDDNINFWLLPEGGLKAKVNAKPGSGYILGVDPRLCDTEGELEPWTPLKGLRWLNGDQPTGRDPNSTDARLLYSAGDLDFDCDVDFVDYAQLAAEWYETDCNNINDFCNGADIVINGEVNMEDLGKFTQRWLD